MGMIHTFKDMGHIWDVYGTYMGHIILNDRHLRSQYFSRDCTAAKKVPLKEGILVELMGVTTGYDLNKTNAAGGDKFSLSLNTVFSAYASITLYTPFTIALVPKHHGK